MKIWAMLESRWKGILLIIVGVILLPTPFIPGSILIALGINKLWKKKPEGQVKRTQ